MFTISSAHTPRARKKAATPPFSRLRGVFVITFVAATSASAANIPGVTATATSELFGNGFDRRAVHAADGSGLSGDTHIFAGEGFFWLSGGVGFQGGINDNDPAITFDLHGEYLLDSMKIWNYSEFGRATSRAQVQVSLNGVAFNSNGEVTPLAQVNPAQSFPLNQAQARYVRFDILQNSRGLTYPTTVNPLPIDSGFVGLAEVQFFGTAVPEPGSLMLGTSMLVGVVIARHRRRRSSVHNAAGGDGGDQD